MGHHGHSSIGSSMGHHHHGHQHHHHHHNPNPPVVLPNPAAAVVLHSHYPATAPCETTPLVCHSDDHEPPPCTGTQCCITIIICILILWFGSMANYPTPAIPTPPEISLESLSVSNLDITDYGISANWDIGLGLYSRGGAAAKYTDIRYSMIYCGDPSSQPIIDARRKYDDLILPPRNQTVVRLKDTVQNLGFNKMALSYMIMDVASDGILEFDLVAKVAVVTGKDTCRFVLSCEGIEVSVSNSHHGSGYATHISNHHQCDLAKVGC